MSVVETFKFTLVNMMRDKLGLFGEDVKDQVLILDLLTFLCLADLSLLLFYQNNLTSFL